MRFHTPFLPAMLAMSSAVFASPVAQLNPDPLGTFVQTTISSAQQNAQANPGNSQVSVCNNGVCTHNPSALSAPADGPPAAGGNNAASGANGDTSSITVVSGNGQTVQGAQGASQGTPPIAPPLAGLPGARRRKDPKKPSAKASGPKKASKLPKHRRQVSGAIQPPFDAATAPAPGAPIDQAVARLFARPPRPKLGSGPSLVRHPAKPLRRRK
ncbi:hypothetical protein MMC18_002457 [Xylographa bjoerkii]|nr:hypothetical protein [Xylographa bjoerkii]